MIYEFTLWSWCLYSWYEVRVVIGSFNSLFHNMKFITTVMPWITSSTRIVLLIMIAALIYMSIAWIEVTDTFKDVIMIVVAFFFWQRANEIKTFADKETFTPQD